MDRTRDSIVKGGDWIPDWLWNKMEENLVMTPRGGDSRFWEISLAYGQMELTRHLDFSGQTCRKKLYRILKAFSKEFWGTKNKRSGLTSHIILVQSCMQPPGFYDFLNQTSPVAGPDCPSLQVQWSILGVFHISTTIVRFPRNCVCIWTHIHNMNILSHPKQYTCVQAEQSRADRAGLRTAGPGGRVV